MRSQFDTQQDMTSRIIKAELKASVCQQQFASDANINNVISRYKRTGVLTDPNNRPTRMPITGEYSEQDYHTSMNLISEANSNFNRLPAKIKQRFQYDPAKLLQFLENPQNKAEAIELGIVSRETINPENTGDSGKNSGNTGTNSVPNPNPTEQK